MAKGYLQDAPVKIG